MDSSLGIAIGGGTLSIAALVVAFVQWSLRRNVENEDKTKERLETRVERIERSYEELKLQVVELKGEFRNLLTLTSELRGLLHEMKAAMEATRDKQAQFYREELAKVEQLLRQDMTRAIQPDLSRRVAELEERMEKAEQRRRR
jgi:chaperonin cofactor prefoldin